MSIQTSIKRITDAVQSQSALISEIKEVLAGKAAGGGNTGGYTGDLYSVGTATIKPASGVSQVVFNNIPKEPDFFVLYLDSCSIDNNHRAGVVVWDGEKIYGQEYYSGTNECNYYENTNDDANYRWRYTYSGTTLTIASRSNSQGGYFHNPGTYTLWYAYKDNENGTVVIEKSTCPPGVSGQQLNFDGMKGTPVKWFAIMRGSQDAQTGSGDTITMACDAGMVTMKDATSSSYAFNAGNVVTFDYGYQFTVLGAVQETGVTGMFAEHQYDLIYAYEPPINMVVDTSDANATAEQIAEGAIAYVKGRKVVGTHVDVSGGGLSVKSGTTTSGTINTGLSDVEQFFLYKESQTATGLIHLHYTKAATSRMYASAWSTQNYGTKTITNGTGGVTVNGGTVTISATQAAQGALSSGVTYKWIAVGTE